MQPTSDEFAERAAREFAARAVSRWQTMLGAELLGAYLIGSLAHGGFSRRYSDVDVAVVAEAVLLTETLDRMRDDAMALSPDWASKLSVFWTDRHFNVGRFPALDRIDYLDNAIVLIDLQRVRPARPPLHEIQRFLCDAPFANWVTLARRFATAQALEPKDHKPYLRTHLYPARLFYSWMTGRIGSNDEAVTFVRKISPVRLDVDPIATALLI